MGETPTAGYEFARVLWWPPSRPHNANERQSKVKSDQEPGIESQYHELECFERNKGTIVNYAAHRGNSSIYSTTPTHGGKGSLSETS